MQGLGPPFCFFHVFASNTESQTVVRRRATYRVGTRCSVRRRESERTRRSCTHYAVQVYTGFTYYSCTRDDRQSFGRASEAGTLSSSSNSVSPSSTIATMSSTRSRPDSSACVWRGWACCGLLFTHASCGGEIMRGRVRRPTESQRELGPPACGQNSGWGDCAGG